MISAPLFLCPSLSSLMASSAHHARSVLSLIHVLIPRKGFIPAATSVWMIIPSHFPEWHPYSRQVPAQMSVLTLLSRMNPPLSSLSLLSSQAKITQTSNSQFLTTKDFSCSYGCMSLAGCRVAVSLLRSVDMVHRLVHMTKGENS